MLKKICLILLFVTLNSSLFALSGQVVDARTGVGLWGCIVSHPASGKAVRSDKEGRFSLDVPGGKLVFSLSGYTTRSATVAAGAFVKISLSPKGPITLRKVVVREKKNRVSKKRLNSTHITGTTSHLFPDTYKVLQMLPGVVTGDDFSSLMYIRGGNFYESLALLDDFILINPYTWGGQNSVFNPNLVKSVDFYAGGFPAMYGQAMSGVMDVSIRPGNTTNIRGFAELSAATFEGTIEGPLGNDGTSSFIVGLRRTYYDVTFGPLFMDAAEGTVFPFFWDGQAKLNIKLNTTTTLGYNFLISHDGMTWTFSTNDEAGGAGPPASMEDGAEFYYRDTRILNGVRLKGAPTDKLSYRVTAGHMYQNGDYQFRKTETPMNIKQNQHQLQSRADLSYGILDGLTANVGLFQLTMFTDLDLSMTSKAIISQTNSTNAVYYETNISYKLTNEPWTYFGTYASLELKPVSFLTLFLGGRAEYFDVSRETILTPRGSFMIEFDKATRLKAATGVYKQFPFYIGNGSAMSDDYGNPRLKAETAYHYVVGLERDITKSVFFRVEGFYKYYTDMVTEDPDPSVNYRNAGERRAWGFDIFLQKKLGGLLDGWITYSWIRVEDRIKERSDPSLFGKPDYQSPVGEWFAPEHDRMHNLSLVANLRFTDSFQIALTYRFSTGTPYTPLNSRVGYFDTAKGEMIYAPVYGAYHSQRVPDYHRLDIKVTMPFIMKGWTSFVQVINLFNNKNVNSYYYNDDYSERKEQTMLPFTFIGGFRFVF